MNAREHIMWNPWHGCRRASEGCAHCYVFELDKLRGAETEIHKNATTFSLPIQKNRAGAYKHAPGTVFWTCFTSDLFLEDADEWRDGVWDIIRTRSDCVFEFFTKRICRAGDVLPGDWGDGYDNVKINASIENQRNADIRARALIDAKAKYRGLICAPLLGEIRIEDYLQTGKIDAVSAGGEAYEGARECRFEWVLSLRDQCMLYNVPFTFHQTGERFIKDGRLYTIKSHRLQCDQARKANIDYLPPFRRNA